MAQTRAACHGELSVFILRAFQRRLIKFEDLRAHRYPNEIAFSQLVGECRVAVERVNSHNDDLI